MLVVKNVKIDCTLNTGDEYSFVTTEQDLEGLKFEFLCFEDVINMDCVAEIVGANEEDELYVDDWTYEILPEGNKEIIYFQIDEE